jgi:hypothetical protein
LVVLSNLESVNVVLIRDGLSQSERLVRLNQIAITQLTSLLGNEHIKKLGIGSGKGWAREQSKCPTFDKRAVSVPAFVAVRVW